MLALSARYEIIREIGSGASAVVYLAQDSLLRRQVALKKLHPHLLDLEESQLRFEKEAVAVASLAHENIVRLYDVIQEGRRWSLALEFISGPSLEALISQAGGSLGPLATVSMAKQALEGLYEAHRKGIIHRDIKPSNFLVNEDGTVKLTDFGIAFLADDASVTRTGYILGTPQFMAPEQAGGEAITDKADVFALGVVVFRCLCGQFPVAGRSTKDILIAMAQGQITPIHAVQPRLIPGLGEWVMRLLSVNPVARPSALEALGQLNQVLSQVNLGAEKADLAACLTDAKAAKTGEEVRLAKHFQALAAMKRMAGQGALAIRYAGLAQLFEGRQETVTGNPPIRPAFASKPGRAKSSLPGWGWTMLVGLGLLALGLFAGWQYRPLKIERENPVATANLKASTKINSEVSASGNPNAIALAPSAVTKVAFIPSQSSPQVLPQSPTQDMGVKDAAPMKTKTRTKAMNMVMSRPGAAIRIRTFPAFMTVWLGDSVLGQTPLTEWRDTQVGTHRLRLIRDEKTYLDTNLFLNPGDSLELKLRFTP